MKKAILLMLMFVILLPSQALAAITMTTSEIERLYFENYKTQVNEVKEAQKNLNNILGKEVRELTEKVKQSTTKYNNAVKSKSNKTVIDQAKSQRDNDKKLLAAAKSKLTKEVSKRKKESNQGLKYIADQKVALIKYIKDYYAEKTKDNQQQLDANIHSSLSLIEYSFNELLEHLSKP
jgi:Skp family chaperone for outer membrane proteins